MVSVRRLLTTLVIFATAKSHASSAYWPLYEYGVPRQPVNPVLPPRLPPTNFRPPNYNQWWNHLPTQPWQPPHNYGNGFYGNHGNVPPPFSTPRPLTPRPTAPTTHAPTPAPTPSPTTTTTTPTTTTPAPTTTTTTPTTTTTTPAPTPVPTSFRPTGRPTPGPTIVPSTYPSHVPPPFPGKHRPYGVKSGYCGTAPSSTLRPTNDPDIYEICDNGIWIRMQCAPGTWFNANRGVCISNGEDPGFFDYVDPPVGPNPDVVPNSCRVGLTRTLGGVNSLDYLQCVSDPNGGTLWIQRQCDPGMFFNGVTGYCDKISRLGFGTDIVRRI